jgi:hypothetical protein
MSRTDYSHGLIKANKDIDVLQKSVGPSRSQSIAERRHDKADGRMYHCLASGSKAKADFNRGQAMGYGMYAHTGKKLKP